MTELQDIVFEITKEHIIHATRNRCDSCMFAQCIKDTLPELQVNCMYDAFDGLGDGIINLGSEDFLMSEPLKNKMRLFDFGDHTEEDFAELVGTKFKLITNTDGIKVVVEV